MQINRENLNKIRQAGQIQINRIRVELNDWLKLSRIFLGLTVKLGTVKSAVLLSTQLETDRVRMITLRRLGRLNTQAQIDQLCAVWYDTRNSMLGNLIAQKEWVASQPLAVKILSSLQAEQADKLDKTDLTVLAELIRLCQAETDLRLARLAADQLNGIQDEAVLKALLSHWTQHDLAPLFSLQEVALLAVTFTAGLRVMVALKLGRLELLTAGGPEIIEPLLAVYTGEDQVLGETARQVLLQLDNPATREKLCELAMQPNQPIVRQVVLQASYYPQEPHQRALFFFLTEQWDKYESLDFDHTLLKFRYDAADGQLRRRIGEMARLNGRAEIATMLVSGSGRGLTKQRLRSMSHEEWQLVVNLLLEGERWEEAWELVGSAPAIYSCQILKRLAEANWEPARSETALTFTDFAIKAAKCKAAYPPLGRQLKVYTKITLPSVQFNDIVISSDGRKLASIGVDNIIRLWSLPEGKLITEFQEELRQPDERGRMPDNTYQVRQLLFSPDGQTLAYDDGWHDNKWQGRWNVLNLTTRIARQVIKHGFAVEWQSKLAFSADGQLIAVDTTEGIRLAEVATGKLLGRLQGATFRNITSLVFSPDDKHLIAGIGQYNGTIAIWKLSDCSLIQNTSIAFGVMKKAFAFQPGSNNLIVAAHDAHIYLWGRFTQAYFTHPERASLSNRSHSR